MSESLKPCPFCGSESVRAKETLVKVYGAEVPTLEIYCVNCGASVQEYGGTAESERSFRKWNTRAERTCGEWRGYPPQDPSGFNDDDGATLWCERCDIELDEDWAYCPSCGAKVVKP